MLTVLARTALLDTFYSTIFFKNKKGRGEKKERFGISSFSKYLKKEYFERVFKKKILE